MHRFILETSPGIEAELESLGLSISDGGPGYVSFEVDDTSELWSTVREWVDQHRDLVRLEEALDGEPLPWLCSCVTSYESAGHVISGMGGFLDFAFAVSADLGVPLSIAVPLSSARLGRKRKLVGSASLMKIAQDILEEGGWSTLMVYDDDDQSTEMIIPFWHQLNDTVFDEAITRFGLQPSFAIRLAWPGPRLDEVADRMASSTASLTEAVGAVYGFVGQENSPYAETRYEMFDQRDHSPTSHLEEVDRVARGSFWCNLLTDKHIETLGGVDRICREAPCAIIEENTRTGPVTTQVRLQVTERFSETTWEMLDELAEYLDPLLP
ncbi:MAG: hypothetical protein JXA36_03735 [Coriobacteriia bacterium]|nr:hypothetical protein [Coriobacteriia bacterium]